MRFDGAKRQTLDVTRCQYHQNDGNKNARPAEVCLIERAQENEIEEESQARREDVKPRKLRNGFFSDASVGTATSFLSALSVVFIPGCFRSSS